MELGARMLTIGQLADLAGVSVRTVRHYHQRGLIPEPIRDASGYRRYRSWHLVRMLRIRALAEIGVPLAKVGDLLDAPGAVVDASLEEIDRALAAQEHRIAQHRDLIARLRGTDPRLPQGLHGIAEHLRAAGVSEAAIAAERDAALLAEVLRRQGGEVWTIGDFYAGFDEASSAERLVELWRRFDLLSEGGAVDDDLVPDFIALFEDHLPALSVAAPSRGGDRDSLTQQLIADYVASLPPAQRGVIEAVGAHFADL
ncbi:MerR family transcriptional regulator [Rhodococcus pyridinivorans]|uniref:MerR family transcriptional regulator n=1 Tax=Rhodococcus pyridinivorans TaxID=103816 RepID=UPI00207905C5|nr:MerR family transcriptional regulator [Rhodococcus pyridinivorans]USI88392.1 MerR family transcriptional regulator [Rhodococcus pyridinivorans]